MKKIICFDIDGVICKTKKNYYSKSKPNKKLIKYINSLFEKGYYIKIFTARYMGRFNDDSKKVKVYGFKKIEHQLDKWKLKYNELIIGKPSYDFFIDDKNLGHPTDVIKNLDKILKK